MREGEKISGRGLLGLGGEVGIAGKRKCGLCDAGVVDGLGVVLEVEVEVEVDGETCVILSEAFVRGKGAGVRGAGTLKRCVVNGCAGTGV